MTQNKKNIFQKQKEQVNKKGLSALNSALDFNEFKVLETNSQYLRNTLQVNTIFVTNILFIVFCLILKIHI